MDVWFLNEVERSVVWAGEVLSVGPEVVNVWLGPAETAPLAEASVDFTL